MSTGEITTVVCDTATRAELLINNKKRMTSVKTIVMIEAVTDELRQKSEMAGIKIMQFGEVEGRMSATGPFLSPPPPNLPSSSVMTVCP